VSKVIDLTQINNTSPWRINIAGAAKKQHDETVHNSQTIRIYMDGSGIKGQIGAAAHCPELSKTAMQHVGPETEFNVYAAELLAINMAVNTVKALCGPNTPYRECTIYADSQPAIIATTKPHKQSGQSIIREILDNVESLQNIKTSLVWIPGHMDIAGNEKADEAAKNAAINATAAETSNATASPDHQHHLKPLKSARNRTIKDTAKREWEKAWKNGKCSKQLRRITKNQRLGTSIKLYNSIMKRTQISQLASLRTGHCSLNQYLHRFHIEESPLCECGDGVIENVEHYLLICTRYEREREKLRKQVGLGGMWIEKLLGDPDFIHHTLEYVKNTKRMSF